MPNLIPAFHLGLKNLKNLNEFSISRNVKVNSSKSCAMVFGNKSIIERVEQTFVPQIYNTLLSVISVTILRIYFDDFLSFHIYIENQVKKCLQETKGQIYQKKTDNH